MEFDDALPATLFPLSRFAGEGWGEGILGSTPRSDRPHPALSRKRERGKTENFPHAGREKTESR
jgi:hypothetical protein